MEIIKKYFPNLTPKQEEQFSKLPALYEEWNEKINVVSRKDIENLDVRHVLHSLAIAKFMNFIPAGEILDLGTGGGFPGIPLAILFPETNFTLVDSRGKKIVVVQAVIEALGLKNAKAIHGRAEELKGKKFDFVVTRAVARLPQLMTWIHKLISLKQQHAIPNGLIALKGGNVKAEIKELGKKAYAEHYKVYLFFPEDFFEEKFVVYVQR